MLRRCEWCESDRLLMEYHDREWGVPVHDDALLFEHLTLSGAQAGLSWLTILKRRESYRVSFDNFNFEKIARYDDRKMEELLNNAGIIRNRRKIESVIKNARAVLEIRDSFGSFATYLWGFFENKSKKNSWKSMAEIPPVTPESEKLSRELRKRNFTFVGPTICYAFMQAVGIINDHAVYCFRYSEVGIRRSDVGGGCLVLK